MLPRSSSLPRPILVLPAALLLLVGACQSPGSSSDSAPLPSPPDLGTVEVDAAIDTCTQSTPSLQTCTVLLRRIHAYGRGTPVLGEGRTITATVRSEVVQTSTRKRMPPGTLQSGEQISAILQYERPGAVEPNADPAPSIESGSWSIISIRPRK